MLDSTGRCAHDDSMHNPKIDPTPRSEVPDGLSRRELVIGGALATASLAAGKAGLTEAATSPSIAIASANGLEAVGRDLSRLDGFR